MKYEYFIASRWRNKEAVLDLAKKMREKGKIVYTFIEGDGEKYELKDKEGEMHPEEFMKLFGKRPQTDPAIREVFQVDMDALQQSEKLILLLPAGKSAHIEAGAAYGMGKECILIGEQKETESLYCIFSMLYKTTDDFLSSI